jgi:hypothetical protein
MPPRTSAKTLLVKEERTTPIRFEPAEASVPAMRFGI